MITILVEAPSLAALALPSSGVLPPTVASVIDLVAIRLQQHEELDKPRTVANAFGTFHRDQITSGQARHES
jgi:hypothetical protein